MIGESLPGEEVPGRVILGEGMIGEGTRFVVIKGGGAFQLRRGQVWDLVRSEACGLVFRKLSKNGSSIRILNGYTTARRELDAGRIRVIKASPPPAHPA
jgi:hypothetical protein